MFDINEINVSVNKNAYASSQWEASSSPARAVDGIAAPRSHPNEFHIGGN